MGGIISVIFGIIEITIGLRFIFELLGATTTNFVNWIYNPTNPLVAPFGTIFGHPAKAIPGTIPHSVFEQPLW